jgi:hypothetical protein
VEVPVGLPRDESAIGEGHGLGGGPASTRLEVAQITHSLGFALAFRTISWQVGLPSSGGCRLCPRLSLPETTWMPSATLAAPSPRGRRLGLGQAPTCGTLFLAPYSAVLKELSRRERHAGRLWRSASRALAFTRSVGTER